MELVLHRDHRRVESEWANADEKFGARRMGEFEVGGDISQLGELQYRVLAAVVEKRCQDAIKLMYEYRETKLWYPNYDKKTSKLYSHAQDLINAIEIKKNFPNFQSLAQSKQEEINEKAHQNMEDLRRSLRRIRAVEKELSEGDSKSSILVIYALLFSSMTILGVYVVKETLHSFGTSLPIMLDQLVKDVLALIKLN